MTRPTLETAGSSGITGRRDWLVGAARWTAAALAVGGGAFLSLGRRGAAACPRPVCSRCGARASCSLPQAQAYRDGMRPSADRDAIEGSGNGAEAI